MRAGHQQGLSLFARRECKIRICTSRTPPLRCVCLHLKKATRSLLFANHSKHQHRNLIGAVNLEVPSYLENRNTTRAAVRTWCGGEMSISNAMLLRFASGLPHGFWDRQRFELVPNIILRVCCKKMCKQSSQQSDQSCFCTNTRTTHRRPVSYTHLTLPTKA